MKILIIFYSRTGTTKKVAENIAKILKADIEEIFDNKNRIGVLGYINAGKDASFKRLTSIKKLEKDSSKYDLLIIGTPIWAGNITPAVRTYISDKKFNKVAFFITAGGGECKNALIELSELTTNPLATLELSTKEVQNNESDIKILEFSKKIKELN